MAKPILENEGNYSKTVIIDIDDTALSTLPFYKETEYDPNHDEYHAYYEAGELAAIPATLEFYHVNDDYGIFDLNGMYRN